MNKQFDPVTGVRRIEWARFTWNVVGGCPHGCKWHMPDGNIAECYAKSVAESIAAPAYPHGFEHHYFREKALAEPSRIKIPSLIFLDSMSDLFSHYVQPEEIRKVLAVVAENPHHVFQVLTKAPRNLLRYKDDFPSNLWVGVSSPPDEMNGRPLSQDSKYKMLDVSLNVLASLSNITWMSFEPLSWDVSGQVDGFSLDWAVIGAGSKGRTYYQPEKDHVDNLLSVLDKKGTPVFYKGNLKRTPRREEFPDNESPAVLTYKKESAYYGWGK